MESNQQAVQEATEKVDKLEVNEKEEENLEEEKEETITKFKWDALESSPEVFNEYLYKVGLNQQTTSIQEVFSFDEEMLAFTSQPVKAVIVAVRSGEKGKTFDW
jgi:hypothetical protein